MSSKWRVQVAQLTSESMNNYTQDTEQCVQPYAKLHGNLRANMTLGLKGLRALFRRKKDVNT